MNATVAPARAPLRVIEIDVAKGIAILLVVLGHVVRGLVGADVAPAEGVLGQLDTALYSFHIPLFIFLSGIFIPRGTARDGTRHFLVGRVETLLWIYVVWSLIQGLLEVALNPWTNGDRSAASVLELWAPQGIMWFLPCLAFLTCVVAITSPWRSTRIALITLAALAAVSILSWSAHDSWPLTWMRPQLALFLAVGSIAGASGWTARIVAARSRSILAAALAFVLGFALILAVGGQPSDPLVPKTASTMEAIGGVAAAFAGIGLAIAVSVLLPRICHRGASWLAYVGRLSLAIYVAHTIFAAGARVVLAILGLQWIWLEVAVGCAFGVAGPILFFTASQRVGLKWLFARPGWM